MWSQLVLQLALCLTLLTTILASPIQKRANGPRLIINTDFPDPSFVQADDGTWYAFGTNGNGKRVQVATSKDFQSWNLLDKEALPTLAGWETEVDHWAPDVIRRVCTCTLHIRDMIEGLLNNDRTTENTSSTTPAKPKNPSATTASASLSPNPPTHRAPTSPAKAPSPAAWTKAGASTPPASSIKTAPTMSSSKSTATVSATAATATTASSPRSAHPLCCRR